MVTLIITGSRVAETEAADKAEARSKDESTPMVKKGKKTTAIECNNE